MHGYLCYYYVYYYINAYFSFKKIQAIMPCSPCFSEILEDKVILQSLVLCEASRAFYPNLIIRSHFLWSEKIVYFLLYFRQHCGEKKDASMTSNWPQPEIAVRVLKK